MINVTMNVKNIGIPKIVVDNARALLQLSIYELASSVGGIMTGKILVELYIHMYIYANK